MKQISFIFLLFIISDSVYAQSSFLIKDQTLLEYRSISEDYYSGSLLEVNNNSEYPEPKSVLYRSLILPGWGQVTNRQIWKVPIVYGVFAGIGYFAYQLHESYSDYRAAYYNVTRGEESDFKFGETPDYLIGVNQNQLRSNRNSLRNRRDFMFIVMGLAYALNAVDAYVFAHMRSFDVSDDLSANMQLSPAILADFSPGISLSVSLNSK